MQFCFELDRFLPQDQCDDIIKRCEEKNATPLSETFLQKQFRIKFHDTDIQSLLQKKLEENDDPFINTYNISSHFTYVRYDNGGYVPDHNDSYDEKNIRCSFLIYLNDNYENGETYMWINGKQETISKKTGKGIIFEGSKVLHGCYSVNGMKHILIGKLYL